jgi:hypothetical protein
MMIKDDPAASGGSYIAAAAGSQLSHQRPRFQQRGRGEVHVLGDRHGTYRIWARVSAPNDGDDSFWVRMGTSGSWIRWNEIPLGTAYHWVLIKGGGASSPSTFNLTATWTTSCRSPTARTAPGWTRSTSPTTPPSNPNAPLTAPPAPPVMQPAVTGNAAKLSWSAVPGATSYTLEVRTAAAAWQSGDPVLRARLRFVTDRHRASPGTKFTSATGGEFRVTAVAPTGLQLHPVPVSRDCFPFDPSRAFSDAGPFQIRTTIGDCR